MEHLDTGTLENWYANRAMPFPTTLRRLAVIAPDDAPGLSALRQRLAQRAPHVMHCDHFAAGFSGAASATLASAFEQIRLRHAAEPYDIVLLLEGRPDALGIAESNGLIPEQVSRTPVPVWTAIGEDDANTTLGDVANRVFSSPAALIAALPMPAQQQAAAASPAPAAPELRLVTTAGTPSFVQLPAITMPPPGMTAARTTAHPLVLCAAGAVIVASLTAIAAMLGWLPSARLATANAPERSAAQVSTAPAAPQAAVLRAAETPATSIPEPLPEPASAPVTPQSNGAAEGAALAAVGAAGIMASTPRGQAANPPVRRAKRSQRRSAESASGYAQTPRQVGSTEVPVVEFVGTKTREQVVAEMMEARRAANRQATNGSYFPGLGGPSTRR
jgi:hypothetical protein